MNIITTFHHSFAGGSKNTCRLIHKLSNFGYKIEGYFNEIPQYFEYTHSKVKIRKIPNIENISEVINNSSLDNYIFANYIIENAKINENTVLFGANLFPYCNILLETKAILKVIKLINPKLVVHPVGSDIWQIGPKIKNRIKWMLENPLIDTICTYSSRFICEIQEYYNISRSIHILPPILETNRFRKINEKTRIKRRMLNGLFQDDFIIHHHSSMREIKCPEIVIEIAYKISNLINKRCILIMSGPIPFNKMATYNVDLTKTKQQGLVKYISKKKNLVILWTGILNHVEYLMQISDVELNASLHDSFNIALMEAMGCALPVITSDIVGISDHIKKSNSGYCFSTKKMNFDEINLCLKKNQTKKKLFDIDSACDAIYYLYKNPNQKEKFGKNGFNYVNREFSFNKVSKIFNKIILK